jgi:hypothetical protein
MSDSVLAVSTAQLTSYAHSMALEGEEEKINYRCLDNLILRSGSLGSGFNVTGIIHNCIVGITNFNNY